MRPTVDEQLEGLARILREVVAPAVDGDYPRDILSGVVETLELLGNGWADVPAFLAWDAAETAELLRGAGIDPPAPPSDPLDIRALGAHHAAVRATLAAHIGDVSTSDVAAHFRARAARYPMRR